MFKINKEEPNFFKRAKKKIKSPKNSNAWSNEQISIIRSELRKHILNNEQKCLCAYCEKQISYNQNKSNIDHFKTRNLFPQETLNYNNLLVSCNRKDTCSTFKDKNIKCKSEYDSIINPVIEDPNDFFDYLPTGEIVAKKFDPKAEYTIKAFNLGTIEADKLVQSRKQITKYIKEAKSDSSLDEILKFMNYEYKSFIINVYNKLKGEIT